LSFFYRSGLWYLIWAYILLIFLTLPVMRSILNALKELLGRQELGLVLNTILVLSALWLLWAGSKLGWRRLLHVAIPLLIILVLAYHLHIPEERVHFLQYGLLGLLVLKTCRVQGVTQYAIATLFVVAVGAGDEFVQWLLPNRVGDLRDVGLNALAGAMGTWIGKSLYWGHYSSST
jgi:VanZ like protein